MDLLRWGIDNTTGIDPGYTLQFTLRMVGLSLILVQLCNVGD